MSTSPSQPAAPNTASTPAATTPAAQSGEPQPKPTITFEEFAKVDLRVAKIVACVPHPSADRLWKLTLDDGSGTPRQICAGIKEHYTPEQLIGTSIVIVANLAPRVIRGEESRGMLLAASNAGKDSPNRKVIVLSPRSEIEPGSIVS
ncbi:MAG: methionine--tRNA ligase subunit beta [Planctomycetota bacterium]|nr:methionine--tRNA ligase subunit beta [Planctomycetota bacterium]